MAAYLIRRIFRSFLTIWLVVSIVFIAFRTAGDPLTILLPEDVDDITRAYYVQKWALDQSLLMQYLHYFLSIFQGDFGQSFVNGKDVIAVIAEALPNTLILGLCALLGSLVIGISAGAIAAVYHGRLIDRSLMFISVLAFSLPDYVLGIFLIFLFGVQWMVLPTYGSETWLHILLPLITISTSGAARIARFARSAMLDVLEAPYLRTARAKGLSERRVIIRHAFRNALNPIVTILGFQLGFLVAGAAIVETVFAWPGIGRLFVLSTAARDLPVVQAITLIVAMGVVLANLLVDLLYGWLDPRISIGGGSQ